MEQLNHELYYELKNLSLKLSDTKTDPWYSLTYPLFINQPFNSIDDFWRAIAFAYSWMPRIPAINRRLIEDEYALFETLLQWHNGDITNKKGLLQLLVPVINNSVTGTSKTLHFITRGSVPIIDKRVLTGWKVFFTEQNSQLGIEPLPLPHTNLNKTHIDQYVKYWHLLDIWSTNMNHQYSSREIEECLFRIGRIKNNLNDYQ